MLAIKYGQGGGVAQFAKNIVPKLANNSKRRLAKRAECSALALHHFLSPAAAERKHAGQD